jgi:hypothetical protein
MPVDLVIGATHFFDDGQNEAFEPPPPERPPPPE